MSGGYFGYVEVELQETVERILEEINHGNWGEDMKKELRNGLDVVIRAYAYIRCLDYVISGDSSEENIIEDIQDTIKKVRSEWVEGV